MVLWIIVQLGIRISIGFEFLRLGFQYKEIYLVQRNNERLKEEIEDQGEGEWNKIFREGVLVLEWRLKFSFWIEEEDMVCR